MSGLFLPFRDSEGDLSRWWEVGGWIRTPREQATRRKGVGVRQGRKPPLERTLALPSRAASSRPRVVCGQQWGTHARAPGGRASLPAAPLRSPPACPSISFRCPDGPLTVCDGAPAGPHSMPRLQGVVLGPMVLSSSWLYPSVSGSKRDGCAEKPFTLRLHHHSFVFLGCLTPTPTPHTRAPGVGGLQVC